MNIYSQALRNPNEESVDILAMFYKNNLLNDENFKLTVE